MNAVGAVPARGAPGKRWVDMVHEWLVFNRIWSVVSVVHRHGADGLVMVRRAMGIDLTGS